MRLRALFDEVAADPDDAALDRERARSRSMSLQRSARSSPLRAPEDAASMMKVASSGSDSWARRKSSHHLIGIGGFSSFMRHPGRRGVDGRIVRDPTPTDALGQCPSNDAVDTSDGGRGVGTA